MFTYQTCSQLIIGIRSYHPLIRLIHENHFKKITIVYERGQHNFVPLEVIKLSRKIKNRSNECILCPVDIRVDITKIDKESNLIISYGTRHVHDIAKQSNTFNAAMYCIETRSAHMSSYGTGVMWKRNQTAWKAIIPEVVFNACYKVKRWDIADSLYFLHNIPLALEAIFNVEQQNDFVIACAMGGILQTLRLYKLIKNTRNVRQLRKLHRLLAQADVLTKNAYNNVPLSPEMKRIASSIEHYRQFEVVSAYESLDIVHNQIRRHGIKINAILKYLETNLETFQSDFESMYNDFINDPKRWEAASDVLGKKLTEIMGINRQTRRLM